MAKQAGKIVLVCCYNNGFTMSDLFQHGVNVFSPMVLSYVGTLADLNDCKDITLTLH